MTAQILSGKEISQKVRDELAKKVADRKTQGKSTPGLVVVLVGTDPASTIYVNMKEKRCKEVGMKSVKIEKPADTTEEELLAIIDELNKDSEIHGILVQLPLPKHINEERVIEAIDPKKDVDGFSPYNFGAAFQRKTKTPRRACTPYGMIRMIEETGIDVTGMNAVVIGRSNIVGLPMFLELLNKNCTVTVCHSRTKDLAGEVKRADIVAAGIGSPEMIKGDWIKDGAIVLDAGINRLETGKLVGDVEFEKAKEHASWITPVPGGVGPMTIAMLLVNTLEACEAQDQ